MLAVSDGMAREFAEGGLGRCGSDGDFGPVQFRALFHMWRVSRLDFYAATIALGAVLILGILHGILFAALATALLLLFRASRPNIAFLGRFPEPDPIPIWPAILKTLPCPA